MKTVQEKIEASRAKEQRLREMYADEIKAAQREAEKHQQQHSAGVKHLASMFN